MAKQLSTSINGGKNLFAAIRQSLTSGGFATVTGNESYTDVSKAMASIQGNEALIVQQLIGNVNGRTLDAVVGVLKREDVRTVPSELTRIYTEAGEGFSQVTGVEGFSMQNFAGKEQDIKAANLTLNAQSHLQTKAAEALFATVGVGYQDEGAELIVRAAGLGTYAYGNTAWQSASDLRPIFGLLRSGEMFKDEVLSVHPVFPDDAGSDNRLFFAPTALVAPTPISYMQGDAYGRSAHNTQMFTVPVTVPNLLALTQVPGQRPWTSTDELESNSISVKRVGIAAKVAGVDQNFFINTAAMSNNTFAPASNAQTTDDRALNLRIKQLPGFSVTDKDGIAIGEVLFKNFKDAGYEPLLSVTLTGNFQRQTGEFNLNSGSVTVFALRPLASPEDVVKVGNADSVQRGLIHSVTAGSVVAAQTTQNVSNTNRGNFGYRIEVYDAKKHLSVQRRSPISVKYPIAKDDVNQASLDFALTHMSIVINNQCSKHAFDEATKHIEYITSIDGSPVVSNTQGSEVLAGQHFVTATAVNRKLKLADVISANGSGDVFNAICSAITNEIADIVAALNTRSGLAAIAEYSSGNTKNKWTCVVHQNLSRFIFRSGDARTIGPIDNLEVVETNFDSEIGRMIIVPYNDSSSEQINPLAGIGVVVSKENIVVQGNVTRDNQDFGVVMTLPTYKHWALNVVIGTLEIEDAAQFLSNEGLINTLAAKRVIVDNIGDAGINVPVVDPNAP